MRSFIVTFCLLLFGSCVSTKVYEQLKTKFDIMTVERDSVTTSLQLLESSKNQLENQHKILKNNCEIINDDRNQLKRNNVALDKQIQNFKRSYELLGKNRNSEIVRNSRKNRSLIDSLEEKQSALNDKIKALSSSEHQSYQLSGNIDSLKGVVENYLKEIDTLEINQISLFETIDSISTALINCVEHKKQLQRKQSTKD